MVSDIALLYVTKEKDQEVFLSMDTNQEGSLSIDTKDTKRERVEEEVEEVVQNTTKKKRTPKKGVGKKTLM